MLLLLQLLQLLQLLRTKLIIVYYILLIGFVDSRWWSVLQSFEIPQYPKKVQEAVEAMTIHGGSADSGNERDIYNEEDANADLTILKRTVINQATDMEMIKEKLNATRKYRLNLMENNETDIREQFPFFFSHPSLVITSLTHVHYAS